MHIVDKMRGTAGNTLSLTDCPTEILEHILSYMFLEDIANLSVANRRFYAVFDPLLYYEDARPFNRHAIYWAAANASIAVAQKALDGGTPINDRSDAKVNTIPTDGVRQDTTERNTSYCVNLTVGKPVQTANMTALVTFFLKKGATMLSKTDKYKTRPRTSFSLTPFGHAMAAMPERYFETIQQHYQEVIQLGEFSNIALVKLAVATGNVDFARETLKANVIGRQLCGGDGYDLLEGVRYLEMDAMRAIIMATIDVDGASYIDRCAHDTGGNRDLVTFVKWMVKMGASIKAVNTEQWADLSAFPDVDDARDRCYKILTHGIGDYIPPHIRLQYVAYVLANMDILDICVQSDDAIDGSSQETLMMMMECACRWGDFRWAKILLDRGADIRAFNPPGDHPSTLLYDAAETLNPDLIKLLLDHGMQASGHPKDGKRSLLAKVIMCSLGDKKNIVPVLSLLLEAGAEANRVIADIIAGYGSDDAKESYPEWGRDHDEFTPERSERRSCLKELCQPGCLELLERHGLVIYRPDQHYLQGAFSENNVPLLERLLRDDVLNLKVPFTESGILPPTIPQFDYRFTKGTLLFYTLQHLYKDVSGDTTLNLMKVLFKYGVTIKSSRKGIISNTYRTYIDNPDGTMKVLRFLLDNGASTTGRGNHHLAAIPAIPSTDLYIQRFLLSYGMDLDVPNKKGITALEALCQKSTHKDRKVLDLYLDHNPNLVVDTSLMDKIAELATKRQNVPMLRTILARRFIEPRRLLTWALHSERIYLRGLDERTVAFAIAMGGMEDSARAGVRSDEEVSLLGAVALGNEDVVMTVLHWYRYCADEWERFRTKTSLEIAKETNMSRAVAYLEQNPHCTATGCPGKHIPKEYNRYLSLVD